MYGFSKKRDPVLPMRKELLQGWKRFKLSSVVWALPGDQGLQEPSLNQPSLPPELTRSLSYEMTRYLYVVNLKLKEKKKIELIGWRKAAIWLHLDMWTWQMMANNLILYLLWLIRSHTSWRLESCLVELNLHFQKRSTDSYALNPWIWPGYKFIQHISVVFLS